MEQCTLFEEKLSWIIDGECDPGDVPEVIEHLLQCQSCHSFFLEARCLEYRLKDATNVETNAYSTSIKRIWDQIAISSGLKRNHLLRPLKRFWPLVPGIAAVLLLFSIGFGINRLLFSPHSKSGTGTEMVSSNGQMTDSYFISIVKTLIQSDRKYQVEMLKVMREVVQIYPDGSGAEGGYSTESPGGTQENGATGTNKVKIGS